MERAGREKQALTPPALEKPLARLDALPLLEGLSRLEPGVVVVDLEGRIVWLSDSILGAGGDSRTLLGRFWREFLVDSEHGDALRARLDREGGVWSERVEVRTPDGEVETVEFAAVPLGRDSGQGAIVALVRRRSDQELRAEEFRRTVEYLSAILDSSPDPVVVSDREGYIEYANPAVRYVLGWDPAEVRGRRVEQFLVDRGDAALLARALEPQHRALREEVELRCSDGTTIWVSLSASPLRLADLTVVGAVAFLRDETERREFKRDLQRKNAELEETARVVSHDLRGPLVSVLGFSRLLREDHGGRLGETGAHYLQRIEEAGRTMEALIRELLDFSRIEGAPEPSALVDPRDALLRLHAELKAQLDEHGIELRIPEDPPLVRCDGTRLYQIFANLIGNALQHMGPCASPRIEVEVLEEEGGWHLTVRDNGRGVAPVHQERIFGMFQSMPSPGGRRSTGIGLAIVRKIAEVHGGRAWVESHPGQGACFHVTLGER